MGKETIEVIEDRKRMVAHLKYPVFEGPVVEIEEPIQAESPKPQENRK